MKGVSHPSRGLKGLKCSLHYVLIKGLLLLRDWIEFFIVKVYCERARSVGCFGFIVPSAAEGLRYPNLPLLHWQRRIPIGPAGSLHVIQLCLRVCAVYSCVTEHSERSGSSLAIRLSDGVWIYNSVLHWVPCSKHLSSVSYVNSIHFWRLCSCATWPIERGGDVNF